MKVFSFSIHLAASIAAALAVVLLAYPGHIVVHGFSLPSTVSPRVTSSSSTYSSAIRLTSDDIPSPIGYHYRVSPKQSTRLFMGWGPEPIWSIATVSRNIQACPSETCVSLFVDVEDGNDFVSPGQYVQVRPVGDDETKPIFLAMASAPTGPKRIPPGATWEFLIKKTEYNSWITSCPPGSTLSLSQVMGSGFPISDNIDGFKYDFPTQNVMLFATGSGIAPIRSAIESSALGIGKGRTCTLYYGVRTPEDMSYVSKFPEWEERGVSVVPVISQVENTPTPWMGRTGYVQNALEEDGVPIPRNSAALLCGVNGMCDSVSSMLVQSGVFEGRILKNF